MGFLVFFFLSGKGQMLTRCLWSLCAALWSISSSWRSRRRGHRWKGTPKWEDPRWKTRQHTRNYGRKVSYNNCLITILYEVGPQIL